MKADGLNILEKQLKEELSFLEYPPKSWIISSQPSILDVAIIGGGMAGLSAAFGLMRNGISNLQVFDENPPHSEGPWATYARMRFLRSTKDLAGPALDLPKLTFRAWYTAQYGQESWNRLYKIPTDMWMDYLNWYKTVLAIPVKNNCRITLIEPSEDLIRLTFENGASTLTRKLILATGRGGFGEFHIPEIFKNLPKGMCAHTCEPIDFSLLKDKDVCIIGCGASGFDAAAEALEAGARSVNMLTRRKTIPYINKLADATYPGFFQGYFRLPDLAKTAFINHTFETGAPPPFESLDRVHSFQNFKVITETHIEQVDSSQEKIILKTSKKDFKCDFLILATGFEICGTKQPELRAIIEDIALWKDIHPHLSEKLGNYPYIGAHYQFLEKTKGAAPYLQNIYCFNYAAILSQGTTSGDIPGISVGALRLSQAVTADFFTQNWKDYYNRFENYVKPEFAAADYSFID